MGAIPALRPGHMIPLRVRRDALPEETAYRDNGCEVAPKCTACPLPECRYEGPGGIRAILNAERNPQIIALRRDGVSIEELSERFGLAQRSVLRVLSQA